MACLAKEKQKSMGGVIFRVQDSHGVGLQLRERVTIIPAFGLPGQRIPAALLFVFQDRDALLFVFHAYLVKLLVKTNPCERYSLGGETQSPKGGEQSRVYFWKRPNALSGLSEPHLGWRQCARLVPLFTSSLTFVELLPPKNHLKCDFNHQLPSLANMLIQGYQMQVTGELCSFYFPFVSYPWAAFSKLDFSGASRKCPVSS